MGLFELLCVVVLVIRFAARKRVKPAPLCIDCASAHIQWGANAERDLHCSFGNHLRPIRMNVLHCTDFRLRTGNTRARPTIGFVQIAAETAATINETGAPSWYGAPHKKVAGGEDESYFGRRFESCHEACFM